MLGDRLDVPRWAAALAERPTVQRVRRVAAGRRADGIMLALAAAVGLVTGFMAVALIELSVFVQGYAFGDAPGRWRVVLAPAVGGLVVGALCRWWMPAARGGGITDVLEAVAVRGGRMRPDLAPAKLLASAGSIGVGASGGREAPVVQIAASVASSAGRLLALSEEQKRALIAAASAAGIAAVFNAPIGGMLFAIEVIVGRFRLRYLHTIVVASVVASVTARELLGDELVYGAPPYGLGSPAELGLYALVGLVVVPIGLALGRGEHETTRVVARLRLHPVLVTGLGGLLVGLIALALPEVLGTGEHLPPVPGTVREPVAAMLQGELAATFGVSGLAAAGVLAGLVVAKLIATLVSIGVGFGVGSFGPAFFVGAATGGAVGHLAAAIAPNTPVLPGALALVGMAAALAATARAPLTGVLIVFELTGDYGLVLPLMLAVGLAVVLAERLDPVAPQLRPLRERGIVYGEPEDVDVTQTVSVGEVMITKPQTVAPDLSVPDFAALLRRHQDRGYPVVADGRLVGIVTFRDVVRLVDEDLHVVDPAGLEGVTVGDICTSGPVTVTPSDPVYRALRRMAELDIGYIPVVSEQDHSRLVGLVRRSDVLTAYRYALARSVEQQQRDTGSRLRDLVGTDLVRADITSAASACGRRVSDVSWPPGTILVSIVRDGTAITPDGDTKLQAGDAVTALVEAAHATEVDSLLAGGDGPGSSGREPAG